MKTNVDKIASFAKIGVNDRQRQRFEKDVSVILSMADILRCAEAKAEPPASVAMEELRADVPGDHAPPDLAAISKNEKDGFVCVARTVGESC